VFPPWILTDLLSFSPFIELVSFFFVAQAVLLWAFFDDFFEKEVPPPFLFFPAFLVFLRGFFHYPFWRCDFPRLFPFFFLVHSKGFTFPCGLYFNEDHFLKGFPFYRFFPFFIFFPFLGFGCSQAFFFLPEPPPLSDDKVAPSNLFPPTFFFFRVYADPCGGMVFPFFPFFYPGGRGSFFLFCGTGFSLSSNLSWRLGHPFYHPRRTKQLPNPPPK